MDVAFEPGDPERGYAVGRGGALLALRQELGAGAAAAGDRRGATSPRSPSPAGRRSWPPAATCWSTTAAAGGWTRAVQALLDARAPGAPRCVAVAGLPDGGAVAAGRDIVIERDGPGRAVALLATSRCPARRWSPRRRSATAPAVLRGGVGRPAALDYPPADELPGPGPERAAADPPAVPAARATATCCARPASGWVRRAAHRVRGLGQRPAAQVRPGAGLRARRRRQRLGGGRLERRRRQRRARLLGRNTAGRTIRARVRTAGVYRYGADAGTPPAGARRAPVPLPAGPVRLRGRAATPSASSRAPTSRHRRIGPDRTLDRGARPRRERCARPGGPRCCSTRAAPHAGRRQTRARRPATPQLLGSRPSLPVYAPARPGDSLAWTFASAFAGFARAVRGRARRPAGIAASGIPGAAPGPGARTHYAFDTAGPRGPCAWS